MINESNVVKGAAQEAVAWQRRYIGATRGGIPSQWHSVTKEEFEQCRAGKWSDSYEFRELYAASVAAAPGIDLRERIAVILRSEFDMEIADPEDHRHDDGQAEALRIADKIVGLLIDASPKGGAQPVAGSAVRALPARWFNEKTGLSAIGCANELTNALAKDDAVASPKGE